jgi:uncharacterized protein YacL
MQDPFYDHKPDPMEKKIRFGCGFLFGLIVGILGIARILYRAPYGYDPAWIVIVCAVVFAFVCGRLAMKRGDRFWREIRDLRWW